MPSVEELLSKASEDEYIDISPINDIITIDPEMRTINLPASETLFGTEQEMDVERKYFKCPKIVGDNIDLSKHQIYITYVTAKDNTGIFLPDEEFGLYYCEDMAVDGDYITFSWLLSGNVLRSHGFIAFAVSAKHMDGEVLKTRWKTKPAVGTVLLTVPDGDSQIVEAYPDIIAQLLDRMNEVEAIATEEAMQNYVETYLAEHPAELDETLTDNTKAAPAGMVGELKGDLNKINDGGLVLKDEVIEEDINKWLNEHPEATTTVQDHSLTIDKMVVGTLGYVTPEMFGAEADGLTDCTDAFKEILNKDNIIILCKTGTYLIKDVIVASANNIVIFGNNTVIKHDNGTSSNELNNNGFITFNECNNLSLCGVTFDNNAEMVKRVNYGTTGYDEYVYSRKHAYITLKLVSVEKFNIKNCTFTHGSAGLFVSGSKIGSITNCISCDNHADGYFITGASKNITVSNCKSIGNDDDSFSADGYGDESESPSHIEFINCIAVDCFGSLCCLYGSNYTKVTNCIGYNLRYLPFKTGLLKVGDTYLGTSGSNQTIDNCTVYISQKPDGDGSQYMEGGKYSCGALIDGDSSNFVNDISITNCTIINKSDFPFVLLMKYASNVNFSNNNVIGFAIKSTYINNYNFENNQMKLIASLFFEACGTLTVVGNEGSSTNIFNFGINNVNCWCTECENVVLVGNSFQNKVSFYSGGKKSGFKTDENQSPGFVANQTNIQVLGVLYTDNWLSGVNYVKGQMILKPDGTLMISDGESFRNIAIN